MRCFRLLREEDKTGVSGTGVVAEGVEFSDGRVCIAWMTHFSSMGIYPNIKQVEHIHGHGGKTRIVFEGRERK